MSQTSEPVFKKTIMIGLGGAGGQILAHLKRYFIDAYGVLPPSIRLLFLDTDSTRSASRSVSSGKEIVLSDQEFLHMKVDNPAQFIEAASNTVGKWFIKPMPLGAIKDGAGAVRQNGRLALFCHINSFINRIDKIKEELESTGMKTRMGKAKSELGANTNFKLSDKATDIYICGSLAGGTGSGTFLDVGILLRDMIPNALIHGFFLLDWVYRNKAFAYRVKGNVYAALSELDNIQSITFGDKHFVNYNMKYGEHEVEVKTPPFSLFHLVDGRNEFGENIGNVKDLCATVANAVFLSVGTMGDAVASVVDNLLSHINVGDPRAWNNKYARYSSFGVSSLYYPARELHQLISLNNAVILCQCAISEIEKGTSGIQADDQMTQATSQDVNQFVQGQNLTRTIVRNKMCPDRPDMDFLVESYEISDRNFPELLKDKMHETEKNLKNGLQQQHKNKGVIFINDTITSLKIKISDIDQNPAIGGAYMQQWIGDAIRHFSNLADKAAEDINKETENIEQYRHVIDDYLSIAEKSRYIPVVGGPRKKKVENLEDEVSNLLNSIAKNELFGFEKDFYKKIIEAITNMKPRAIHTASEVTASLNKTYNQLRKMENASKTNIEILKSITNQIVIGDGNIVIVSNEQGANVSMPDSLLLDYNQFKNDTHINKNDDYLGKDQVSLFHDYCLEKLEYITNFDVHQAIETIGENIGRKDEYIKEQLDHLFRLSSALWSYDKGRINEIQDLQYGKIVHLGVNDAVQGQNSYARHIKELETRYNIRYDVSFSTTGDNERIWLLNFAAALPVHFLSDINRKRKKYEDEITPTYHIDKYLEMNVPDLFPQNDVANIALRVLGMAIVPGIDVIHDEKLTKGHEFTCNHESVKKINLERPKVWNLFRDMYEEVTDDYNPNAKDNLLDILQSLLKAKVNSMSQEELKAVIEKYVNNISDRLEARDFSRLISARLTYREIKELENYLDVKEYNMEINRYIAGK